MADHTWEDEVEPALNAADWVLERLYEIFDTLEDNGKSEDYEFGAAANEVRDLIGRLRDIRNTCFDKREGESAVDEVDVQKIMHEKGLKDVAGVHYKEEAYTGFISHGMVARSGSIQDYLDGRESWEDTLKKANSDPILFILMERHGPIPERLSGNQYLFLYYNPRWNLMNEFTVLRELRVDHEGVKHVVEARWHGLAGGCPGGIVQIYQEGATDPTFGGFRIAAAKSCTHLSQLIKLLESIPPKFDSRTLAEEWMKL